MYGYHFGSIVERSWGHIPEDIHHLGGDAVVKLKLKGFDNRFRGAAVTTASIRKQKQDVRSFGGVINHWRSRGIRMGCNGLHPTGKLASGQ